MIPRPIAIPLFILPWLLVLAGLSWLAVFRFPPSGMVTFDVPFDGSNAWTDPFLPAERVTSPGAQDGGWRGQRILADPVYGAIRIPGAYDEVHLDVEFRPTRQPIMELGILRGEDSSSYEYTPIWLSQLENAAWRPASFEGILGYVIAGQKNDVLASAEAFSCLLLWRASTTMPVFSDDVAGSKVTRVSLRGGHDFWAVPANGTVSFAFEFQDANRSRGSDAIVIRVFRGDEELRTDAIGVGGSREEKMGRAFTKTVALEGQPPGVYRIQIIADDDVFIRSIATPSRRWVVGPRLVFGDLVGYSTTTPPGIAWSDSRHLVLETFHNEGLQRVTFGNGGAALEKTHEQIRLDRTDDGDAIQTLVAPKGDVRIVGDGWFAFSKEAFFSPAPRRVTDETDLDREGICGVVTPYVRPESLGDGWYRARVSFSLDASKDRTRISLSAPGLQSRSGAVDIRRMTLTYRRPPLSWDEWWRTVKRELANAWRRMSM